MGGESKDRKEANGRDVPGTEGRGDEATGLEIVVIPSTAGGTSLDAGRNLDDSVGAAPPENSKVRLTIDSTLYGITTKGSVCRQELPLPPPLLFSQPRPGRVLYGRSSRAGNMSPSKRRLEHKTNSFFADIPLTNAMDLPERSRQIFQCGYPPLCLDEWEGLRKAARVVCIRGRYTTYLDRETSSLFYHDEASHAERLRRSSMANRAHSNKPISIYRVTPVTRVRVPSVGQIAI